MFHLSASLRISFALLFGLTWHGLRTGLYAITFDFLIVVILVLILIILIFSSLTLPSVIFCCLPILHTLD